MEVVAIHQNLNTFKENVVQNILNRSTEVHNQEIKHRSEYPESRVLGNVSLLTDNLILTSASNVNPQTLESFNVSCLISCAPELPDLPPLDNILYHKVDVMDSGNCRIFQYFDTVVDLIQKVSNMEGRTLVYCVAGVSRSATMCIAYVMKHHKYSLLEAYNFVKLRRPRIKPNCGFFKQLIEYEKHLFGCNTVSMVFNEIVQMDIPDVYDSEYKLTSYYSKKGHFVAGRR